MKTAKQIEEEFRADFDDLLAKYKAEWELVDDESSPINDGWHYAQVVRITVSDIHQEFCEFNL